MAYYNEAEHYHLIGGSRRGLLVDPGASNGLIRSETLRDIIDTCPHRMERKDYTSFAGISGTRNTTLGELKIPCDFGASKGSFTGDVIGGDGSLCPALLSNPALKKMQSVIFTDFFNNGATARSRPRKENGSPLGSSRTRGTTSFQWTSLRLGSRRSPLDRPPPSSIRRWSSARKKGAMSNTASLASRTLSLSGVKFRPKHHKHNRYRKHHRRYTKRHKHRKCNPRPVSRKRVLHSNQEVFSF